MSESDVTGATPGEPEAGREEIERRAYEISQSEDAGTPEENWQRAEQQLREGRDA